MCLLDIILIAHIQYVARSFICTGVFFCGNDHY